MTFTVWVGGIPDVEHVSLALAQTIRDEWIEQGYDDVIIEEDQQ